jgi:Pyruvate/2-oxoacid:ferredoxin oxidoreductase delta subunit
MVLRKILRIDEEKCTGCGICIPSCAEGAIKIVDGKARLVSEKYCDGLGACIGECSEGAISIEEREAEEFDEEAVSEYLSKKKSNEVQKLCPAIVERFNNDITQKIASNKNKSYLSQWPIKLELVPTKAKFFEDSDLILAADCVPFAYPNFHEDFLKEKAIIIGCSKLNDTAMYEKKLTEIIKRNNIRSLKVVNMEVPCCFGLHYLVKKALKSSDKKIPLYQQTISIKGEKKSNHLNE